MKADAYISLAVGLSEMQAEMALEQFVGNEQVLEMTALVEMMLGKFVSKEADFVTMGGLVEVIELDKLVGFETETHN
jgi:hypothetical protein